MPGMQTPGMLIVQIAKQPSGYLLAERSVNSLIQRLATDRWIVGEERIDTRIEISANLGN